MNTGKYFIFSQLFRISRISSKSTILVWRFSRNFQAKFKRVLFPTGGLLSLSLWSKSSQKTEADVKKEIQDVIQKSDLHYDQYEIETLYNFLKQSSEKFPDNGEILWRLARVTCEKGKITEKTVEKKKFMRESFDYITKALEADENNFAVHKWYGIIVQYVAELEGTKEKILKATVVKNHFEKATELNPADSTSWHLLGLWHYHLADLHWYERQVASVLYATPPHATFQDALIYFEKAESINPNFYSQNLLMLGKTYLKLFRDDLAKQYLQRTLRAVVVTVDDKNAHEEAYKIIKQKGWES